MHPYQCYVLLIALMAGFIPSGNVYAADRNVAFNPQIGAALPLNLNLVDESNKTVTVGNLLHKRPAILLFNYYRCANVCGVVIEKTIESLRDAHLKPGKNIDLLIVSIDPRETAALAFAKKSAYVKTFGDQWIGGAHFLTGSADALKQLQHSAGFTAFFDIEQQQYIHPVGLIFLDAQARIAGYIAGLPNAKMLAARFKAVARGDRQPLEKIIASICEHLPPLQDGRSNRILSMLRASIAAMLGAGAVALVYRMRRRQA
jgi:protein SCO1/2